jgi:hypothetical protein
MTEIPESISIDQIWQSEYPEGYENFLKVYGQKIVYLKLYYLKHIRRYGKTKLYLLDLNGNLVTKIEFNVNEDGQVVTSTNCIFQDIYLAWKYFQDLVFDTIIKQ